jgi:hypothetical protein
MPQTANAALGRFVSVDACPRRCRFVGVKRTSLKNAPRTAFVKVCGCRPQEGGAAHTGGRRTQTSKGGNRGRGHVGGEAPGYGDLSAADEVGERSRGAPASRWTVKRLLDERRVASNSVSCRTICDDRHMSGRALPWPVERQRVRRSDLRECDAVMRCRA